MKTVSPPDMGVLGRALHIDEVLAELGISRSAYNRLVESGKLPMRYIGDRPVIFRSALDKFKAGLPSTARGSGEAGRRS